MKKLLIIAVCVATMSFTTWQTSFDAATQAARDKHELILLNFSGSDWCGPCIRLRKEILDNDAFTKMADTTLILVNADFPRNKKNQPDVKTRKQNEALADKYNSTGAFPYTILIDADGKVIRAWSGLPNESAIDFAKEVRGLADANRK